jgi:divalent metal cation (Fe/Co/Zn/Cd) transporter
VTASGNRRAMLVAALRLSWASVLFGLASGAVSVTTGLRGHSLGVLAVGLGVLADVAGSVALVWRFLAELRGHPESHRAEVRAAVVVGAALAIVSAVLFADSIAALLAGSRPGSSGVALAAVAVSLVVLTPLAVAKRRLGTRMASPALRGDGALSGLGAATSLFALLALVLYHTLGWWWADRAAALLVAVIAATESWRTLPRRAR